MSSNEGSRRMRRVAVAAALGILLGACPSVADEEGTESLTAAAANAVGIVQAEPQRGLMLRDALALALEQSPDLA